MVEISRRTRVIEGLSADNLPCEELVESERPAILRGVAKDWPLVGIGSKSPEQTIAYLLSFYSGRPVVGYTGAPEIGGRFFYSEDLTGLNFDARRVPLDEFLGRIAAHLKDSSAPSFYIGSTDLDAYLPGLRNENGLSVEHPMFGGSAPLVSIWIGNRTVASAHFDMSNNLACCMVGRRRFTLFPPEQIHNLYPGPLEPTPGGQIVSMVDGRAPDLERYPRFRDALEAAEIADLEPGDVLFYPAMWWHQVEALDAFNVMINYWWNVSPAFVDTPMTTLLHGLLSLRDRPEQEKSAWRELFEYYVFGPADRPIAHLPEHARGNLAPLEEVSARRLRAELLRRLNR